jgi:nucleotide-binding universal stress UspA family protein
MTAPTAPIAPTAVRHILVGTDLSEPARLGVARAFALASEHDAGLTLCHVVQQGALTRMRALLGQGSPTLEASIEAEAEAELGLLAAEFGANRTGTTELRVSVGVPVERLLAEADAHDSSLVVVGSRGEGIIHELVLGSTAERLVRKTPRPVLVVRQPSVGHYRQVLVAIDFSPESIAAVAMARAVAPAAELVLFHAVMVPFEGKLRFAGVDVKGHRVVERRKALDELARVAADAGLEPGGFRLVATPSDPVTGILDQARDDLADLIVIGKRGQTRTEQLLLGSVTKHVLFGASCDLLVCG